MDHKINLYTQNVEFTRYIPATSMSLNAEKTALELEETTTIKVSYNPITATGVGVDEITWSVDKEDVVTFYNDVTDASIGLYITASNPGQVKVTATNGDGITASIDIIVNEPVKVESITLSTEGDVRSVEQYQSLQINATVVGEKGETPYDSTLTWTSSNDEVLSVDDKGIVRGLQVSSEPVTITATYTGSDAVNALSNNYVMTITQSGQPGQSSTQTDRYGIEHYNSQTQTKFQDGVTVTTEISVHLQVLNDGLCQVSSLVLDEAGNLITMDMNGVQFYSRYEK